MSKELTIEELYLDANLCDICTDYICLTCKNLMIPFIQKVQEKERKKAVGIIKEFFLPSNQEIADAIGTIAKEDAVENVVMQLKALSLEAIKLIKND